MSGEGFDEVGTFDDPPGVTVNRRWRVRYKIGDVVEQRICEGMTRFVLVQSRENDIKNGRPGFSGVGCDAEGNLDPPDPLFDGYWGYDYEVVKVVKGVTA